MQPKKKHSPKTPADLQGNCDGCSEQDPRGFWRGGCSGCWLLRRTHSILLQIQQTRTAAFIKQRI